MKKEILSMITLCLAMHLFSQNVRNNTIVLWNDDFSSEILKTNDLLLIYGNDDAYLMSSSPLSFFDGYKKIYENHNFPDQMPRYFEDSFSKGPYDKEYQCIWFIKNNQLYLGKILFDEQEIDAGRKDQYFIMEQFTGGKFDVGTNNISLACDKICGLMPAIWFSDTLLVKKSYYDTRDAEIWEKDQLDWQKNPYIQMVFEEGKLITLKGFVNKVEKVEFVRPRREKLKMP